MSTKFPALLLLLAGTVGPALAQADLTAPTVLPSPPVRKIGPNDLIAITVFEQAGLTRTVRVDSEGLIRLPLLKDNIKADGLMPQQLEKVISRALKDQEILVDPFVTVTVAEYYRPMRPPISVIGAVKAPITFQSVEPISLLEAITRAGGVSPEAGTEILVQQTPATVNRVRVKSLVDAADPSANLILTGGEEIRIPEAAHIYIFGNVKKPGTLPVEDSSDATVFKAIALSEGLAPYAARQAYIFRREAGSSSRSQVPIDLKGIVDHKAPDVPLLPNDILYVPDNTSRRNTLSTLKIAGSLAAVVLTALIYVALR